MAAGRRRGVKKSAKSGTVSHAAARKATRVVDPVKDADVDHEKSKGSEFSLRDGPDLRITDRDARKYEKAERLIVTGAMNYSRLAKKEWETLWRFADEKGAEILVIPLRYRNPTSPAETSKDMAEQWRWPSEVMPYVAGNRFRIHPFLYVMGDYRIPATRVNPLMGCKTITRAASGIFGHAQISMETIPTPQAALPKILHTTGAITHGDKRYSQSAVGAEAEFHHTLGAVYIEKENKRFHLRQLLFDKAHGFYDLDRYFHPRGSRRGARAKALITGDTHREEVDPDVVEATYGPGGLVEILDPEYLVWHDLLSFISGSHWDDPIDAITKALAGENDVRREITRALDFMVEHTPRNAKSIVVASNHDDHLRRWVLDKDWKSIDAKNVEIYLELAQAMVQGAKLTRAGVEQINPFAWWAENVYKTSDRVKFLKLGESFRLVGTEMGYHGHVGPGGRKGSPVALDRVGTRMVTAHLHGPRIYRGLKQVGTCAHLNPTYIRGGPSNSMHTHCALYDNGKWQLANIIEGHFRG
jgi:hypothetical protein